MAQSIKRCLVLVANPKPESLSHALRDRVVDELGRHTIEVFSHDLFDERFNPVLTFEEYRRGSSFDPLLLQHIDHLERSDRMVIIHPDWWGGPPAILKGWVDRMMRPGIAYEYTGDEFSEKRHTPLLTAKSARIFITTDLDSTQSETHPAKRFWLDSVLPFAGIDDRHVELLHDTRKSSYEQRSEWIKTCCQRCRT